MNMIPPMITGNTRTDVESLRSYLVMLARSLDTQALSTQAIAKDGQTGSSGAAAKGKTEVEKQAATLKALIIKNANDVRSYTDRQLTELSALYLAKSEFGTFEEALDSRIDTTARGTVESYGYSAAIQGVSERVGVTESSITTLNGEIRRGVIEDPDSHLPVLGIAISEKLLFTGETVASEGQTYYRIAPGQTFGLYTSKGWQFWVNGARAGWFSSEDGMLHVGRIVVENTLQLGEGWQISTAGGFGVRYTGTDD